MIHLLSSMDIPVSMYKYTYAYMGEIHRIDEG